MEEKVAATDTFLVTFRIGVDEAWPIIGLLKDRAEFVSAVRESQHDSSPPSYVAAEQEGEVLTIDSQLVAYYLVGQIDQLLGDAPTNNYECGYLHALILLYRVARGFTHRSEGDARSWAAERLISNVYVPPQSAERSQRQ